MDRGLLEGLLLFSACIGALILVVRMLFRQATMVSRSTSPTTEPATTASQWDAAVQASTDLETPAFLRRRPLDTANSPAVPPSWCVAGQHRWDGSPWRSLSLDYLGHLPMEVTLRCKDCSASVSYARIPVRAAEPPLSTFPRRPSSEFARAPIPAPARCGGCGLTEGNWSFCRTRKVGECKALAEPAFLLGADDWGPMKTRGPVKQHDGIIPIQAPKMEGNMVAEGVPLRTFETR